MSRFFTNFASSSCTPVAILSLDQEKAFDRVDWSFMRSTLSAMGFGTSFISWVDIFYHRVQSAVNVNGYLSSFFIFPVVCEKAVPCRHFFMSWSLRFLRPTSVAIPAFLVFVFLAVTRSLLFPNTPMIRLSSCHLTMPSKLRLRRMLSLRRLQASGSKLNLSKSKGLWLGGWRGRSDPSVALDWTSSKLKVLGVFIGVGDLEEDNWHPRLEGVDRVLKSWRSRCLSFRRKALVINALALS